MKKISTVAKTTRELQIEKAGKDSIYWAATFIKKVQKDTENAAIKVHAELVMSGALGTLSIKEDKDVIRGNRFPADTRRSLEKQINDMLLDDSKPTAEVGKTPATKEKPAKKTKEQLSDYICTTIGDLMLELRKEFKLGESTSAAVESEICVALPTVEGIKITKKPFGFQYNYEGETRQFYFAGRGKNAVNPSTRLV